MENASNDNDQTKQIQQSSLNDSMEDFQLPQIKSTEKQKQKLQFMNENAFTPQQNLLGGFKSIPLNLLSYSHSEFDSGKKFQIQRPKWDNRAHITDSKNNKCYHTQYRQYFDKKSGDHQYTDRLKYIYKTPSNGENEYQYFENKMKFYWEKRQPIDPDLERKHFEKYVEGGFLSDFQAMFSKNNPDLHPSSREYFDFPVNHIYKGFIFSPKHKLPLELYHNGNSHYNVKEQFSRKFQYQKSFVNEDIIQKKENINFITTGMPDKKVCRFDPYLPRMIQKKSGKLSNDYGIIPDLRSTRRRNLFKATF